MIKENYIKLFEKSIKDNWDIAAFSDYGENNTLKYGEVGKEILKLHILFEKLGIEKGDKISLIGKNGTMWSTAYLATITYGCVIVPILQDFSAESVHHIVNHSDSKLLFATDTIWEVLDIKEMQALKAVFNLKNYSCCYEKEGENAIELVNNLESDFNAKYPNLSKNDIKFADVSNSELICISYTSGTTGFSKGVMLTANNFAGNVTFGRNSKLLKKGDRCVAFLPMAHAYGCAFDFLTSFCVGAHTTYLGKVPTPKILLSAFAEIKPTIVFTVPLIMEKIYKKQLLPTISKPAMKILLKLPIIKNIIYKKINEKLRGAFGGEFYEIIIGGAALGHDVEEFFHKIKLPYSVGYGMTECAPLISYRDHKEYIPTSCGQILVGMEVKILSNDPYNEIGEICVRGEHVMMGYYKNEEATNAVIDKDGWLHTGDMGKIDRDGNIFIRGRNKSMLLGPSGQNIYPEEIEAKLNNMPYIAESLVIQNADNRLVALVFADAEAMKADHIDEGTLMQKMEENRKALNAVSATYENVIAVQLHSTEFEKTPKKSIKRYLYADLLK